MTKDTFKQFVNKDGYAKGGVPVEESPQNLELDPRSKSSIRGRNCKGYLVLTCGSRQLN